MITPEERGGVRRGGSDGIVQHSPSMNSGLKSIFPQETLDTIRSCQKNPSPVIRFRSNNEARAGRVSMTHIRMSIKSANRVDRRTVPVSCGVSPCD